MNTSCLVAIGFFLSQTLCASSALSEAEIESKVREIHAHGQYSYEEFKELLLPHLDQSLHAPFEEGFGALFTHSADRTPHARENELIACFFKSIAGKSTEVQGINLASRLMSAGHERFLSQGLKDWADGIFTAR